MAQVIHRINGKTYLYDHQRVGNKVVTTYLYPVDSEGQQLKGRRTYIKQRDKMQNEPIKDTKSKSTNYGTFEKDKEIVANRLAKTTDSSEYIIYKDGIEQERFNNRYDADSYIQKNASDQELKEDREIQRFGKRYEYSHQSGKNEPVTVPTWNTKFIEGKKTITNIEDIDKIMGIKDEKHFYTRYGDMIGKGRTRDKKDYVVLSDKPDKKTLNRVNNTPWLRSEDKEKILSENKKEYHPIRKNKDEKGRVLTYTVEFPDGLDIEKNTLPEAKKLARIVK